MAVLLVLLFHGNLGVSGGYIGVDVFFVISGYLITGLILKEQENENFSLKRFWQRRVRRIIPASFVCASVTFIFGCFLLMPEDLAELARSTIAQQLMASNIFFWKSTGYFAGPAEIKPLLHTWSLAVEEQFYLAYPFFLVLLRRTSRKTLVSIAIVIALLSLAISEWGVHNRRDAAFYLLPTRAWEMLLGGIVVMLPKPAESSHRWMSVLSWLGALAIFGSAMFYSSATPFPGVGAILPCVGASLIIYSNATRLTIVGRCLAIRPMVFIGLISYSLYLWHWPILAYSKYWMGELLSPVFSVSALLASFALAVLSWRYVETPFRYGWKNVDGVKLFATAGLAAVALMACAFFIHRSDGLPNRYSTESMHFVESKIPDGFSVLTEEIPITGLPLIGAKQNDQPPTFLLWGDSHLQALASVSDEVARQQGMTGAIAFRPGVPPLLNAWCVGRKKSPMTNWNNSVRDYIRRHNIKNVVLVARWTVYAEGKRSGSNDMLLADDQSGLFARQASHASAAMDRSLRRTIDDLTKDGVRVWIFKQVPTQLFDPGRRLLMAAEMGLEFPKGTTKEWNEKRHSTANAIIDSTKSANVQIVAPAERCYDASGHSMITDGTNSYYWDDNHFSIFGATVLTKPLFEELFSQMTEQDSDGR